MARAFSRLQSTLNPSPLGEGVLSVAPANGRRQLWVRLLAGGAPLQVTRDDADHEHPRWAPDSSSLIYFSGAAKEGESGTLWEVSALGGMPRRIASTQGEGDISHDGRRIATFRRQDNRTVLAILERDGLKTHRVKPLPALAEFSGPRWSPDDRWIAFVGAIEIAFNRAVYVMDAGNGEPKNVASAQRIQGLAWLPDSSGLVYASSAGSTMARQSEALIASSRSGTSRMSSRTSPPPASCSPAGSECNRISGDSRPPEHLRTT